MSWAYVDTSCLVAIAFEEPGYEDLTTRLERNEELFSSGLLEAEFRAALFREQLPDDPQLLSAISWVLPRRPLSREISHVLAHGHVRGADLWHLSCALFLAPTPADLVFVSKDSKQLEVAKRVGFST